MRGRTKSIRWPCSVEGCPESGYDHGDGPVRCPGHRRNPNRPMFHVTPFGRVVEAAIELADVDAENDIAWANAKRKLMHAVEAWKDRQYVET